MVEFFCNAVKKLLMANAEIGLSPICRTLRFRLFVVRREESEITPKKLIFCFNYRNLQFNLIAKIRK